MKISKVIVLLCLGALIMSAAACGGGGKYSDAKKVVAKSNKILEDFLNKMDTANDGDAVAAALRAFVKDMKAIAPEMQELQSRYPELADRQSIPPELGEEGEKMADLWMKFGSVMMKIQQYADHPEVQKAQEEMSGIFN